MEPIRIDGEFEDLIIDPVTFRHVRRLQGRKRGTLKAWIHKEAMKFSPELYCASQESEEILTRKLTRQDISKENIIKILTEYKKRENNRMNPSDYLGDIAPITFGGFNLEGKLVGGFQLFGIKILSKNNNIFNVSAYLYSMFGREIESITSTQRVRRIARLFKEVLLHDFVTTKGIEIRPQKLDFTSPFNYSQNIRDPNTLNWATSHFNDIESEINRISNSEIVLESVSSMSGFRKWRRV